ncbi:protein CsbA [Staphylococcus shinii]|uniref:CsbA family protein n=1 Tax=Staphylococcus shinii TaxID=2912228 RepID=UPI0008535625|nr:CsbA family protein [Staphylococcus shinii]OEK87847.1 protein CsbA [Staphylococcus shinii]
MIWYALAAFFPCIFVVLFSLLTRNKWVGTILTLVIIGASVQKGFFHSEWIIFIDVVSMLAGYLIIDQLELHKKEDE